MAKKKAKSRPKPKAAKRAARAPKKTKTRRAPVRSAPRAAKRAGKAVKKTSRLSKPATPGRRRGPAPIPRAAERYDVHPSVKMVENWVATMKEKTGRSLQEWIDLTNTEGPRDEAARRDWLKMEHGLGSNAAWWIAERASGRGWEDGDPAAYLRAAAGYVGDMYAGGKAGLRPLHDELLRLARGLGPDVKVCPCKTIVPLFRSRVFAEVKPSTRARIDFGLALARFLQLGGKTPPRLIDTGGMLKRDRITHRIEITKMADIDDEVREWMRRAYELDAEE